MSEAAAPAATWYDDPHDPSQLRWWDGSQWTEHVAPHPTPVVVEPVAPALQAVPELPRVVAPAALPAAAPDPSDLLASIAEAEARAAAVLASTPRAAQSTATSRARPSGRALSIAGGAVVLVLVLAFAALKLVGGSDAATSASSATGAQAGAAAPAGPALTPQQYVEQLRATTKPLDDSPALDKDATPAQIRAVVAPAREAVAKMGALNPPAIVATEHTALVAQFGQMVDGLEQVAANPKDEAAGMALFGTAMGLASTVKTMETKLGMPIDLEKQA